MDIQLIAMDLDGTALLDDHVSFSDQLNETLLEAHRRGIAVVPVTGRQFALLPPPLKEHPVWENLSVLCNGAEVRSLSDGTLKVSHYMEPVSVLPLIEISRELALPMEISAGSLLYLTGEHWAAEADGSHLAFHRGILARNGREIPNLVDFCLHSKKLFEKINFPWVPADRRSAFEEAVKRLPFSCVWPGELCAEITHPEADKAHGVAHVCKLLGIDQGRVLAIGDSGNDIPMLKAAGMGVAMGNAPCHVKKAAKAVTASNMENGAALAIRRYAFGK